jgi:hypothetical protein
MHRDEPTLFYAERSTGATLTAWAVVTALLLPFAILAPAFVIPGMALSLALAWINLRHFRFAITPFSIRLRLGVLAKVKVLPLDQVVEVEATDLAGKRPGWNAPPAAGHLMIQGAFGPILVACIKDPVEAASAIREIKRWGGASEAPWLSGPA